MDDSEVFVLVAAFAVAVALWGRLTAWTWRAFAPRTPRLTRISVTLLPLITACIVSFALHRWGEVEVRDRPAFVALFTSAAVTSLGLTLRVLAVVIDLDVYRHAVQGANQAAMLAVGGLTVAVIILNLGANLGAGDSIATTFIPLVLGSVVFVAFLTVLNGGSALVTAIVSDRRIVAGIEFSALSLCAAVVLARQASGDWHSLSATVRDFAVAVPALIALLAAERWIRGRGEKNTASGQSPDLWLRRVRFGSYLAITGASLWLLPKL